MAGIADDLSTGREDFPKNPSQKFIKLKSGVLSFYDKEKGEETTLENQSFVIIDDFPMKGIGYDKNTKTNWETFPIYDWSLPIEVFCWKDKKRTVVYKGLWQNRIDKLEIKDKIKGFHRVISALHVETLELVIIEMSGGQFRAFGGDRDEEKETQKKYLKNIKEKAIKFIGKEEKTNPSTGESFFVPTFAFVDVSQDIWEMAKIKAREYVDFKEKIINKQGGEISENAIPQLADNPLIEPKIKGYDWTQNDDIPFPEDQ